MMYGTGVIMKMAVAAKLVWNVCTYCGWEHETFDNQCEIFELYGNMLTLKQFCSIVLYLFYNC